MKFVSWNLLPTPFRLCRFQYFQYLRKFNFYVSTRNTLFGKICFRPEIPFLGKFGPKKSKLLVQTEIWFLDWYKFSGFKRQCWLFQFRPEMSFLGNLVPKIKIISLSWNLIPILIGICRIQWCCSICLFRPASFFVQKLHFPFWYCLINLSAVYLQRLEASGFSCYKCNY